MKPKAFDLIIFDWDGTLINSVDWIAQCLQQAGERYGYPAPDYQDAKHVIGLSIDNAMRTLFPTADAHTLQGLIKAYSTAYFTKSISRDDLFAGVYDMLVNLKQAGYRLAVATGKTRMGLNAALAGTATAELFTATRCADETASKPHPKMLDELMQVVGVSTSRTLLLGDSVHDLQMANNAHITALGVSCGAHPAEVLQRYQPLACFQQPVELLEFLQYE